MLGHKNVMLYYLPILIIVLANIAYHVSAKSVPKEMDSFFFLSLLYIIAGAISFGIYFFRTGTNVENVAAQVKMINWVPFVFAIGIIGILFNLSVFLHQNPEKHEILQRRNTQVNSIMDE